MSSKNQSRSFGLAVRNNNVRAAIAVVSMDAQTLSRLNFQPHLVLTMISKNVECVTWFVNFLRGLPEGRRETIFRCKYKNKKSIILLRDAGIPRHWLSSGEFTPKQYMWMVNIGYTDMSPRESDSDKSKDATPLDESYVEESVPNVYNDELPSPISDICIKSISDESPPATPGPESGINMLSQTLTSDELNHIGPMAKRPPRVVPSRTPGQEQCDIM